MTLEEQLTKYGRPIEALDALIADHPDNTLVVETEFLNQSCKASDLATMLQLLSCAQYIAENGTFIGDLAIRQRAPALH
jgi:hypothetical protein